MKTYIKPNIEVTDVMLESPILAASSALPSTDLGTSEIDGSAAQALEIEVPSVWGDDDKTEE